MLAWRKHHGVIEEGIHALLHHGQVVLVQHVLLLRIEGVHARSRRAPHVGHGLHVLQQGTGAGQPIPQAAVHWRAPIELASRRLQLLRRAACTSAPACSAKKHTQSTAEEGGKGNDHSRGTIRAAFTPLAKAPEEANWLLLGSFKDSSQEGISPKHLQRYSESCNVLSVMNFTALVAARAHACVRACAAPGGGGDGVSQHLLISHSLQDWGTMGIQISGMQQRPNKRHQHGLNLSHS